MEDILDLKDRKILYQLDLNCRQSNGEIAKKVGLSKDAVGYRIKSLEDKKIIRGYTTIIDSAKLGYLFYRVFFNLIDLSPEELNKIIEFLKKENNIWWIAKLDGSWNFAFAIWVKSNLEFRDFYNKFCAKFKEHIKEKLICPITAYKQFGRSYLLENNKGEKMEMIGSGEKSDFDKKDVEILEMLAKNARISLIEIAGKTKRDSMAILRRIKKLEEKKVIQGYRVDINFNLLKRDFYSVKINLKDLSEINKMESYIKSIPEVTAITEAIGSYDFEFDLEVENSEQYFKIIEELRKKFLSIREIIYFRVLQNYKILYLPEAMQLDT